MSASLPGRRTRESLPTHPSQAARCSEKNWQQALAPHRNTCANWQTCTNCNEKRAAIETRSRPTTPKTIPDVSYRFAWTCGAGIAGLLALSQLIVSIIPPIIWAPVWICSGILGAILLVEGYYRFVKWHRENCDTCQHKTWKGWNGEYELLMTLTAPSSVVIYLIKEPRFGVVVSVTDDPELAQLTLAEYAGRIEQRAVKILDSSAT